MDPTGPLTRARLATIQTNMLTGSGSVSDQIKGLESIDYNDPSQRQPFAHKYLSLIKFLHHYFMEVGFRDIQDAYWSFIQNRIFHYFDKGKNCIIEGSLDMTNEHQYVTITPKSPFRIKIDGLAELKTKIEICKDDKIFLLIVINDFAETSFHDRAHSNLLVIDRKTKEIYAFEPNYDTDIENNNILLAYNNFIKLIGDHIRDYTFKGYYPQQTCNIGDHGGMCSFIAILSFFYPKGDLTYSKIKERLMEYLKWELKNIENGLLVSFGKTLKNDFESDIKYLLQL
jgi:hypothetical protein